MEAIQLRLSRLFPGGTGNTVIVAIDHGQTFGPMEGLVQYTSAAERLREADAVLLPAQMIRFTGNLFVGKGSPMVIARLNWNTIHCEPWRYQEAHIVKAISVSAALASGADMVLASLVLKTGSERNDAANVEQFSLLVGESHALGLPIIGEVFPIGGLRDDPAAFHDYVRKTSRIACELGADAIKTFYTGEGFSEITSSVPIPIFALGAEKLELEDDALKLAAAAVAAGARGVVFGRNVVQARDPAKFLHRLRDVVRSMSASS